MTTLSDYRASLKRIIEADDPVAAFKREGYGQEVSDLMVENKSFKASRSATIHKRTHGTVQRVKMPHGPRK